MQQSFQRVLGVDIGGSGVKAAVVDTATASMVTERLRRETPDCGSPREVLLLLKELVAEIAWEGPVGVGFPGVVRHGRIQTAANLDAGWIGRDLRADLRELGFTRVATLNDADAAGLAELTHRAAAEHLGTHLFLTIGTGIGSALLHNGHLVPNTELGHLWLTPKKSKKPVEAEEWASNTARKAEDLLWPEWAERCSFMLTEFCRWLGPDSIILGGGITKRWEKFGDLLSCPVPVYPAKLGNDAGIIGAALAVQQNLEGES